MSNLFVQPQSVEDIQVLVQNYVRLSVRGGQSKHAFPSADAAPVIDMRGLAGILEYEPGEYTFTALAGTPLRDVAAALAQHQQFLPFDPPLVDAGATLGGTVAAGLSGSGRYRYGGVRDFLIGVRFVDGQGRLVRGGGKVVKNAAGFDLPKLMVGSLGQFGIITEVSFKVFPQPAAYATLQVNYTDIQSAVAGMQRVVDTHFDVYALDLIVDTVVDTVAGQAPTYQLLVRIGGLPNLLSQRIDQIRNIIGAQAAISEMFATDADAALWTAAREFTWAPPAATLVKVATSIGKVAPLESALAAQEVPRRYAVGGNLLWLAWSLPLADLDSFLLTQGLGGLVVRGGHGKPLIGRQQGQAFARRIKQALDPHQRFPIF